MDVVHVRLSVSKPSFTFFTTSRMLLPFALASFACKRANSLASSIFRPARSLSLPGHTNCPTAIQAKHLRTTRPRALSPRMDDTSWLRSTSYKRALDAKSRRSLVSKCNASDGKEAPSHRHVERSSDAAAVGFDEVKERMERKRASTKRKRETRSRTIEGEEGPAIDRNDFHRIEGRHLKDDGVVERLLRRELDAIEANLKTEISADVMQRWLALETGKATKVECGVRTPWSSSTTGTKEAESMVGQRRKDLMQSLVEALETNAKNDWIASLRTASNPQVATDRERSMVFNAMQRRGCRSTVDLFEAALQEWRPKTPEQLLTEAGEV